MAATNPSSISTGSTLDVPMDNIRVWARARIFSWVLLNFFDNDFLSEELIFLFRADLMDERVILITTKSRRKWLVQALTIIRKAF